MGSSVSDERRPRAGTLLLAVILGLAGHAQYQLFTLTGSVTDPLTGAALPGAEVHLHDALVRDDVRTPVDSVDGAFSIAFYPLGRYTIRFTAPGRIGAFMIADLSANEYWTGDPTANWTLTMDLQLAPYDASGDSAERYLGTCVFLVSANRPAWQEAEAAALFPITVEKESRKEQYERYRKVLQHKGDIVIRGTVMHHWDRKPLSGAEVRVSRDRGSTVTLHTDSLGFYAVVIPFEPRLFTFSAPGMVSKSVLIDGSSVPKLERIGGYGMVIDIKLFEPIPGIDFSFLAEPMGRATYDPEKRNMAWDMDFTQPVLDKLNRLLEGAGPPQR